MDERARRLWAGTEAGAIGYGGVALVARATGMAISTVRKGRDEARAGARPQDVVKVRRSSGTRAFEAACPEAWSLLSAYPYPGNMRQLRHVLRLAGCTAEDGVIMDADLDLPPFGGRSTETDLEAAERATIVEALRKHGGRVTEAARALKLSRATLYRKIKQLKIETAQ